MTVIMVAPNDRSVKGHSPRSQESHTETISVRTCSPHSPSSLSSSECSTTKTVAPPTRTRKRGRLSITRLAGIETLFLLLTSIGMIYIITCSTRSSYTTVYHEGEWMPTTVKRAKRRVIYSERNTSSLEATVTSNTKYARSKLPAIPTAAKVKEASPHPRVVFYEDKSFNAKRHRRIRSRYDFGSQRRRRSSGRESWSLPTNTTGCVPMKSWQTTSFPSCNKMHEINLVNGNDKRATTKLLGTGGWRATWKVSNSGGETVALKTLK